MIFPSILTLSAIFLGSIPAGVAAAFISRELSETDRLPIVSMTGASAAIGIWATLLVHSAPLLAVSCALGWTLLVLAAVDVLAFRLPDVLTLPLMAAGLGVSWWLPERDILGHAVAALLGVAIFYAIAAAYRRARGQEGLGLGDMKLAGAAGAWLGWQALPFVVLLACAVGFLWVGDRDDPPWQKRAD
ncbi:MAG: A24 family peptidase [Rhizomicrobium sp.]